MMSKNEKFTSPAAEKRPYGKYLLFTGGAVLTILAIRKVPWKRVKDSETFSSLKETLISVTERLEDMGREYMNARAGHAVSQTKQAVDRLADAASTH